ncbi:hypothetical protein OIU77_010325 [Salix suchowensis]|uniref:Remorin N-terminal domain-containing protein n=1 Tax=Salix suchowensis TaxID=1278906 RepID=A0ABQ9AA67_9ROSI|nr:hypothetical protein OIU77_010325 [Salix suchowensis]
MAEQEVKRVDTETPVAPAPVESKSEVADEKAIVPPPPAAEEEEKFADGSKDHPVAERNLSGVAEFGVFFIDFV